MSKIGKKLLNIVEGEVRAEILITAENLKSCEQMAREFTGKKGKKRPLHQRVWFYSDEGAIPVSREVASRALEEKTNEIFEREKDLSLREARLATKEKMMTFHEKDFAEWKKQNKKTKKAE